MKWWSREAGRMVESGGGGDKFVGVAEVMGGCVFGYGGQKKVRGEG